MRFQVLGPLAVRRGDEPISVGGPQQRRLLALLIIERRNPVRVERIVDVLWPDGDAPDGAARSVKTYVSRLRAALGAGSVVADAGGYRLDCPETTCDADDFERLVTEAARALPDQAVPLYEEALRLWRGPAFGEFTSEWWALPESTRLSELAAVARERWAEAMVVMGHGDQAIPDLERLVHDEPFRERPVALLMQALRATGRQADALRAFNDHRTRLADHTGLEPSADLVELERSIVASDHGAPGPALRGYVIRGPVGEGAFGRVYEATQPGTERRVAVKAIRPDLADSTDFIRRFESEARLVARLEHPHIVPLYDYWREPGGAYLVFRLLTGGSARSSVVTGGPWSLPRVDRLVEEIGAALIHAHAAGVQHNDVRSANVLLDDDGTAYLTDFGIADVTGSDHRAAADDIRSFAWLIWGLLVGDPEPHAEGRTPSLIGRVPDLPDDIDGVLAHATDPAKGFGSVAELVLAWRVALGHAEAARRPVTSDERLRVDSLRRAAARHLEQEIASQRNPYRGLEAFDDVDQRFFFGRTAAVAALAEEVDRHPFVLVVGASGSGKSSLVRAGLIPQLRERGSIAVVTVPGDDPVRQLDDALDQVATVPLSGATGRETATARITAMAETTGAPVIVVIDQIEELWTASPVEPRTELIAELASIVDSGHARVIATVRADMLDRPLQDPVIGPHVGAATFVVAPLTPAELDETITLPAASVGVTVDGAVVAQLVAEASSQPGSLPMLQFTLTELYDRRVDGRIDLAALESLGGLGGAIGRRAEAVLGDLGPDRLDPARELFGRLVTPGIGGPDTRRRARVGELSDDASAVADAFVAARLLVIDRDDQTREPTVEIAHEALLTRWARLADWIDEDRQWLRQLQQLSAAAAAWEDRGRNDADLYRGARLEAAIEAIEVDGRPATALERAFVEAGRNARDSEMQDARRTARRLRRLLAGTAAALAFALLAGSIAAWQRRDAERAASAATAAERAGRIEGLVGRAESLRPTQRDVAALLALEAHRLDDNARTRSALFGTFTEAPGLVVTHRLDRPPVEAGMAPLSGIVMPDGTTAFVLDAGGRVAPLDLESGDEGEPWPVMSEGAASGPAMLRASPDGRRLAQLSWVERDDGWVGMVGVADVASRDWVFDPVVLPSSHASASFSDDGDVLYVTLDPDNELVALDASSGERLGGLPGREVPEGLRQSGAGVAVVSGGRVVVGDIAGRVRIVDGRSFDVLDELTVRPETTFSLRTADGGGAVVGTGTAGLVKIDLEATEVTWSVIDGADACPNIAVLDEPGLVLCGDHYGRLVAREVASGVVRERLDPQRGNVGTIWPADGQREVVTFGVHEPVITRWRLDGGGAITRVVAPGWWAGEISPAATKLVVVPAPPEGEPGDGTMPDAKVMDISTGEGVIDLTGMGLGTWVNDTDFSVGVPDDRGLTPMLLSTDTGAMRAFGDHIDGYPEHFEGSPGKTASVLVSPDGTGSRVEVRLGDRRGAVLDVEGFPHVAISRTGHRLAIGHESEVTLHDGVTGELVGTIRTPAFRAPYITVADQLFLASRSGELAHYDLETLEPVRTLGGSRGHVRKVDGTADGSLIAVKGGDRFVTLHDVASGLALGGPMVIPDTDIDATPSMSLSVDGTTLVYGGGPTSGVKVWDLRPARWREAACGVAGRNLTRDEWRTHIGDLAPYRATCPQFPTDG